MISNWFHKNNLPWLLCNCHPRMVTTMKMCAMTILYDTNLSRCPDDVSVTIMSIQVSISSDQQSTSYQLTWPRFLGTTIICDLRLDLKLSENIYNNRC